MRRALVIGSAGQDGIYLTRLLRSKSYRIYGVSRNSPCGEVDCGYAIDLSSPEAVREIVASTAADEIYFLAAFHHSSEEQALSEEELVKRSIAVNTLAFNSVLSAVADLHPTSRVLYASSSRVFGEPATPVQDENTPLSPTEPYGISKAAGMEISRYWRRTRGVFVTSAILYNHESPLRGRHFLSRKIVEAAVSLANGHRNPLRLGNISARADWGHAVDTVNAMWLM